MNLRTSICRVAVLAVLAFAPMAAHAQNNQQEIVDRARLTVTDLSHDKAFGNARQLLQRARAVMIVPRLFKGGFIVGGEGGEGVLLARGPVSRIRLIRDFHRGGRRPRIQQLNFRSAVHYLLRSKPSGRHSRAIAAPVALARGCDAASKIRAGYRSLDSFRAARPVPLSGPTGMSNPPAACA